MHVALRLYEQLSKADKDYLFTQANVDKRMKNAVTRNIQFCRRIQISEFRLIRLEQLQSS